MLNTEAQNMKERLPINKWIDQFLSDFYDSKDVRTQIIAGWYDWFCKDSSLRNKTYKMGNIIAKIKNGGKVDLDGWYVWFKNNCPKLNGPLYDDFRFERLDTFDIQFIIQIDCCWNKHRYSVYGRTPDGEGHWDKPLFETDDLRKLVRWFNLPWKSNRRSNYND